MSDFRVVYAAVLGFFSVELPSSSVQVANSMYCGACDNTAVAVAALRYDANTIVPKCFSLDFFACQFKFKLISNLLSLPTVSVELSIVRQSDTALGGLFSGQISVTRKAIEL